MERCMRVCVCVGACWCEELCASEVMHAHTLCMQVWFERTLHVSDKHSMHFA